MRYHLGILGHPVGTSLSPLFHATALRACGFEGTYERFDLGPDEFAGSWKKTLSKDFDGFNVTVPFKVSVIPFLDDLSAHARKIGAVNVLVRRDGIWTGHNTDVVGVTASLLPHRGRIEGSSAVVIGAGGAARAVLGALIGQLNCSGVLIVNRDMHKAEALAREWADSGAAVAPASVGSPEATDALRESSLIVQATSAGMVPHHDQSPLPGAIDFSADQIVFDLIYRPRETRFLRAARSAGATVIDGLEMFLHQAAASFTLWTGSSLSLETIRPVIERELSDT